MLYIHSNRAQGTHFYRNNINPDFYRASSGDFIVEYDATFKKIDLTDGSIFFSSPIHFDNIDSIAERSYICQDIITFSEKMDGPFVIIAISDEITVVNSLYRSIDVFYKQHNDTWIISDSLSLIRDATPLRSLNTAYARDFVLDNVQSGAETLFSDVFQFELGSKTTLNRNGFVDREPIVIDQNRPIDINGALVQNIENICSGKKNVIVHFSGGLDSSLVLAAACSTVENCQPLHIITPDEVNRSELNIASQVAIELGCELQIHRSSHHIAAGRKAFRGSRIVNSPFDVYPFAFDVTDRSTVMLEGIGSLDPDQTVFLSGQGGDSVFVQNPHAVVVREALQSQGLIAFAREAFRYSSLKGMPLIDVVRASFAPPGSTPDGFEQLADIPAASPHISLQGCDYMSSQWLHMRDILEALMRCETPDELGVRSYHPLMFQNIIGMALSQKQSYSSTHDRIVERNALFEAYNLDVAWRRSKASQQTSVFGFFRSNKKLITEFLLDGYIINLLQLNPRSVEREITSNSTSHLTYSSGAILNMISLEFFCQQHVM